MITGRFYLYREHRQTFMYVWSVPDSMGRLLDHFRCVWDES